MFYILNKRMKPSKTRLHETLIVQNINQNLKLNLTQNF